MTSDKQSVDRVPADFPRPFVGSVSGAQNKLIVRKIDGRFVEGMTEEELWVRYDACRDLVMKLSEHAKAKRGQYAELSLREFLRRFRVGVVKKGPGAGGTRLGDAARFGRDGWRAKRCAGSNDV